MVILIAFLQFFPASMNLSGKIFVLFISPILFICLGSDLMHTDSLSGPEYIWFNYLGTQFLHSRQQLVIEGHTTINSFARQANCQELSGLLINKSSFKSQEDVLFGNKQANDRSIHGLLLRLKIQIFFVEFFNVICWRSPNISIIKGVRTLVLCYIFL